jgi:hypothetical protein
MRLFKPPSALDAPIRSLSRNHRVQRHLVVGGSPRKPEYRTWLYGDAASRSGQLHLVSPPNRRPWIADRIWRSRFFISTCATTCARRPETPRGPSPRPPGGRMEMRAARRALAAMFGAGPARSLHARGAVAPGNISACASWGAIRASCRPMPAGDARRAEGDRIHDRGQTVHLAGGLRRLGGRE